MQFKYGLIILVLLLATTSTFAISACGTLSAGVNTLTTDVSTTATCFTSVTNSALDCAGHKITGNQGTSIGFATNSGGTNITVKNCNFFNLSKGVVGTRPVYLLIQSNNFTNITSNNIDIGTSSGHNINITSNIFNSSGLGSGHCIQILNADNALINNNNLQQCTVDGIRANGAPTFNVTGNTFTNIAEHGMWYDGTSTGWNISSNTFTNVVRSAIMNQASSLWIGSNTIINATVGLNITTTGNTIWNNTISNSITGVRVTTGGNLFNYTTIFQSTAGNDFINQTAAVTNNFYGNTFGFNPVSGWINWSNINLTTTEDIVQGTNFNVQQTFVSVNSTAYPDLNAPANITLSTDSGCVNVTIYSATGYPLTVLQIMSANTPNGVATCSGGIAWFLVSGFSGYTLSTTPVLTYLISPVNINITTQYVPFQWICNNSANTSIQATLSLDGATIITQPCANNTLCTYNYSLSVLTCNAHLWNVLCQDVLVSNQSTNSSYGMQPIISFIPPTPTNNSLLDSINPINISSSSTCAPNNASVSFNSVSYPAVCVSNVCYYANSTIAPGNFTISATYQDYFGFLFPSAQIVLITVFDGSVINSNVTLSKNYTFTEFTTYTTSFYNDWGAYIFGILSYAFAFLLTRRIPQTLIAGAVGLLLCCMMTGNLVFLAASIFSMLVGLAYKQAVG